MIYKHGEKDYRLDGDDCTFQDVLDVVMVGIFNLCSCFDHEIWNDMLIILKTFQEAQAQEAFVHCTELKIEGPEKYKELLLHLLHNKHLTTHGSSARGSWITEKGSELYSDIVKLSK